MFIASEFSHDRWLAPWISLFWIRRPSGGISESNPAFLLKRIGRWDRPHTWPFIVVGSSLDHQVGDKVDELRAEVQDFFEAHVCGVVGQIVELNLAASTKTCMFWGYPRPTLIHNIYIYYICVGVSLKNLYFHCYHGTYGHVSILAVSLAASEIWKGFSIYSKPVSRMIPGPGCQQPKFFSDWAKSGPTRKTPFLKQGWNSMKSWGYWCVLQASPKEINHLTPVPALWLCSCNHHWFMT